ncbi:MAG TPA: DUF6481 family protein [Stellaceae bacterium]|jgi:hypothetical protein|nr:DUF6481 family protein [Stellaceae bacterium]
MSRFAEKTIADRQRDAAAAKKAALDNHRSAVTDPGHAARLANRDRIAAERDKRIAERKAARLAEEARLAAIKAAEEAAAAAARAAAEEAERIARAAEEEAKAIAALALEAEKQAARDARYAARKERKRKGR